MQREPGWIPRDDRKGVHLDGIAELENGRTVPVRLTDLSRDGCCVSSDDTLVIGERIELTVAGFDKIVGNVRWSLFGTAGVRFEDAAH